MANYYQKLTEYYRDLRFRAQAKAAENNARARKDERWRKIDNRQTDLAVLGCYGRKHYHRRCEYQRHAAGAAFGDGQLCDAG